MSAIQHRSLSQRVVQNRQAPPYPPSHLQEDQLRAYQFKRLEQGLAVCKRLRRNTDGT